MKERSHFKLLVKVGRFAMKVDIGPEGEGSYGGFIDRFRLVRGDEKGGGADGEQDGETGGREESEEAAFVE